MAAGVIRGFKQFPKIFATFKQDPLKGLKELEKVTKTSFGEVNIKDIEVLRSLTSEELELLAALSLRAAKIGGKKPFKLD